MEEYKTYTLDEISKGKGSYGIAASAVPFDSSLYTYLRITDINDDGSLNKSGLTSVDENNASNYLLKPNDIVFARTGNSTGRSYFYDGSDGELVYAGFLIKFSLDESKVNPRIMKYYTHSKPYYDWVRSFDTGGTRGNINAKTYGNMPITLPSRPTQDRIVEILKSLDDKIEVNKRINDNLEQQMQATFDDLLMDDDLALTKVLKNYAFVNPSRNIKKGEVKRYIDMSSLPTKGSFPSDWNNKPYNGGMKFQNGDTIMARITPCLENGKTAYINFLENDEIAFGSTEYIVMAPHNGIPSEMFYFLARNEDFVAYAVAHMNGSSGRQRVSATDIENYIMPDIPTNILEEFGKKIHVAMECIKNNSMENRKLATFRDALLPKLMSGEIRVTDTKLVDQLLRNNIR